MIRLLVLPLVLLALLLAAMAWSGTATPRRADFAYIDRADINTLNVNQMAYVQDFRVTYAIREGLFEYDPVDLHPVPAGATSVDVSPDKKRWVFHLRKEARWTNGDPVVAADYLFAWRHMLEEPGDYTYLFYYVDNAREYEAAYAAPKPMSFDEVGVKAPDPYTLVVTLHDPCAFFLDLISFCPFYPLNERSMLPFRERDEKTGRDTYRIEYTRPPNVVTNGAFELKDWKFKRSLWLEKSPSYWDRDHVKLASIEVVVNEDPLSQILLYESGAVDWVADTARDLAAELKERGRTDLQPTPGFGTSFLNVNCSATFPHSSQKNPLGDVRVRQAFTMAIEKQRICDTITRMGERPATTYTPPGIFPGFDVAPGLPYDVARAKQLLAEAGYPGGAGFPAIPFLFSNVSTVTRDEVQYVANQLKENLNVKCDLQSLEGKIFSQRVKDKDYVLSTSNWIGDYGDPSTFTDKYLSTSLNNDSNWAVPAYDALCDRAARETDAEKRLRLLEKAERIIDTDLPVIPVFYIVNVDLARPWVKIHFNPRMTVNFKGIDVDREARRKWREGGDAK